MAETFVKDGGLCLDRVVFYGRTLHEYQIIFNFDHEEHRGLKALDCPGGSSSFTAEACRLGVDVVAVDPMFGKPAGDLLRVGEEDINHVMQGVSKSPELFNWSFYPTQEVLRSYRMTALRRFAHDYATPGSTQRYINGSLPNLPFADDSFDIALSGHFLFTYSDRLDYDFHLKAMLELVRVSREVLIYPVVGRDGCKPGFFGDLLSSLGRDGVDSELIPSNFEFQKGGGQVLRLTCRP
jgi:hypothetical protein